MTIDKSKVKLEMFWHGLKRWDAPEGKRLLPHADLYIDCRVVPEKGIKGSMGQDPSFQAGVLAAAPEVIKRIVDTIVGAVELIPDRREFSTEDPFEKPVSICFFCAYGQHRSPSSCLLVADRLRKLGYNVAVPYTDKHHIVNKIVSGFRMKDFVKK